MPSILPGAITDFIAGKTQTLRVFKSGPGTQAFIARRMLDHGRSAVIVVPGAQEFKQMRALLALFSHGAQPEHAPAWERDWIFLPPYLSRQPDAQAWSERWAALYALTYGKRPCGVLMTVDNLLPHWPEASVLRENWVSLTRGEEMSPDILLEQLVAWGYVRRKLVSAPGEMAMRGDILDIHAPGYDLPLRLEFFGDAIEEIRLFDPATQRSRADLTEAVLLPVSPGITSGGYAAQAREVWNRLRRTGEIGAGDESALLGRLDAGDAFVWPGMYYSASVGVESYFPEDSVYLLSSGGALRARLEDQDQAWRDSVDEELRQKGVRWPLRFFCRSHEGARTAWQNAGQMVFEELTVGREKNGIDLAETPYSDFTDLFWQPEASRRPWTALIAGLREWGRSGFQTILSFRSERSRAKFLNMAEQEHLPISLDYAPRAGGLFALVSPLRKGMELAWSRTRILGEEVLQPEAPRAHSGRDTAFKGLDKYEDLSDGDLLVHRDYGLAQFGGLHHMSIGDAANDYLLLFFSGDDKLYLPVDRLNLVQRFKGPEGARQPALDKLGGTRWSATTAKVRKAVEKIAQELVEMYAFRRVAKGFSYGPPDDMYSEFEATFGFEETPDQDKAVRDVFSDMEKPEPMDRLVCGDVGFGKTEVALRAAFRAALEGRQTALLCPTTVLAEQHYQTFSRRMEGFPVRIGLLSRFVPAKRQQAVLQAASRGELDILIGTHRILSKDVELPNLGLLILDEEQRFGVKHKEKLKHFRHNIDVLTLTATPIPRTLQLSLSGIRGLSVIETPPLDRKPVETAITERDPVALKAALHRELERGGQVYWVYNRVNGLERVVEFVRELAPDARVGMAHGQMSEKGLEDAMRGFWHGELDVLVCTAIVESGLDFPNANTLIVDQAQLFGLGQLYQLRGRVGRSDRQAYAYFVVPSIDDLSEMVRKRLRIILDMDYLGAGFKIAMEDLRMRGAGNILGEAQSGQIAKVGLDLFLEMLEEEVRRVRGETEIRASDPELNFVFEAHIPGSCIPDARERLRYYRALSSARDEMTLRELEAEIRDRFGHLPDELETFLGVLRLKQTLSRLRATRAELYPARGVISWGEGAPSVSTEALLGWVARRDGRARLLPPAKLEIRYDAAESMRLALENTAVELEELLEPVAVKPQEN
ncbi:MAG: transcription-repair coupling factor [Pseudodesulfovibrio sp.]|uniref:Transcription-repair-coupling factor n=1 Tax=Pseudodesulfovibrio aespoeensis (strain ATCC 700646 / DSM 10631 / Aspo-2) TaxID=643562 RepID=E6VYI3_PSEA9|nr:MULTISPECIES: transcription-repair coupling factor [Pseudodesulfovibrio]MBU4193137.1 transcription-repair coupling factor [Pseudomonadota bacterium]ADU62746.1 transcription-repair coupling factor [Pseudodesulfovibrio aespoeensis Aspo-2]MBU4244715.1 transcription-repair coupling factor [Pseudomonadota bacterium]MBU4379431.1 transcription-repair coupling factor [Pseudomonadota bacterium]MBU4474203.1 transcription-repair coupling factor [Pseudomonadota bacterium]